MEETDLEPDKKIVESVEMNQDGSLTISNVVLMKFVSPGMNMWKAEPGSHDFIDFATRHGVTKLGQRSRIIKELRDGLWKEWQEKEGDWP